jgi:two-component system sensor histidine kinase YesM
MEITQNKHDIAHSKLKLIPVFIKTNMNISHNGKGMFLMIKRNSTFFNITLLTLFLFACILIVYTYSNNSSLNTVRTEIQSNSQNQLRFVTNNIDHNISQLNMLMTVLSEDRTVSLLSSVDLMDSYEQIKLQQDLSEKMNLQSFSEGWSNQISIYSTILQKWIGASTTKASITPSDYEWQLDSTKNNFVKYKKELAFWVQVTFPKSSLITLLDSAKLERKSDPFFYFSDELPIYNSSSNIPMTTQIIHLLGTQLHDSSGSEIITIDKKSYFVNYVQIQTLKWYMVDYTLLDEALSPIIKAKNLFYLACLILLISVFIISMFLYRKIQIPLNDLMKGVRFLKQGNFSFRIKRKGNNEFSYLYENFNEMAEQIEELIENVYKEKIISREALLKQLQAQINPHFLYNCLFFINNMVRLGNDEAATAMTQNLAEYFRYTSRIDEPMTSLKNEIAIIEKYLTIQSLRMDRLSYEIQIPPTMNVIMIPKLLLQPLIENSIIHGIEKRQASGSVRITGIETEGDYKIVIEDDGKGLTDEELKALVLRINQPLEESMGCALWNIQQRLNIYFPSPAGIEFSKSSLGGLCVTLYWAKSNTKGV